MRSQTEAPLDAQTLATVHTFLQRAVMQFPVKQAILFGSRARGHYSAESDADLALILCGEKHRLLTTKLAMSDLAFDVLLETGIRIEALPIWEDDWQHPENFTNPALLRNIQRDGVQIQ